MLIQQLLELENDGIVKRTVYNQLPPKVEYSVTEYGLTLNSIIDMMCTWGEDNISLRKEQEEDLVLLKKNQDFD